MDDFTFDNSNGKLNKRHIVEPNLVPVIDMLTAVIFFLLLSTVFMSLTKLSIPPSGTTKVTIDTTKQEAPLNPKLFANQNQNTIQIFLSWGGNHPDTKSNQITIDSSPKKASEQIAKATSDLIVTFNRQYPKEKNIQIGVSSQTTYQVLISLMDGALKTLKDVVLMSYLDAESLIAKTSAKTLTKTVPQTTEQKEGS